MALQKDIVTSFGVTFSYWKITEVTINNIDSICTITISPFLNKETRDEGYPPMTDGAKRIKVENLIYLQEEYKEHEVTEFTDYFSNAAILKFNKNIYEIAYDYIKEKVSMFKDAEDI